MIKITNKYFAFVSTFFIFLILLSSRTVFADDYAVTDVTTQKVVYINTNLDVNIEVANNTNGGSQNIDVNVELFYPKGGLVDNIEDDVTVQGNETGILNVDFNLANLDVNASNSPFSIKATIIESGDSNPTNDSYTKYFVISKGKRKVPVPDMPIYFGLGAAVFIMFIFSKKNNNKE